MEKYFSKYIIATKAMALCCESSEGLSAVAESEVYNETWMLRLTLAMIHDYNGEFQELPDRAKGALERVRDAVRVRWVSEGGLEPAFESEGPTWTDAILGNVLARGASKRGIAVKLGATNDVGVVVVEAKMGSDLSTGVTNSSDYNQAARNIACLSKLLLVAPELVAHSCFCVFAPDDKVDTAQATIDESLQTVLNQRLLRNGIAPREYKGIGDCGRFESIVAEISRCSVALSWDMILKSMRDAEGIEELWMYYRKAKAVMLKSACNG